MPARQALEQHRAAPAGAHLRRLFDEDPARFGRLSASGGGILPDYSKPLVTAETLRLLAALARGLAPEEAAAAMREPRAPKSDIDRLLPHRVLSGNRPTTSIVLDELGKRLASRILPKLDGTAKSAAHDASTAGSIKYYKARRLGRKSCPVTRDR